MMRQLLLSLLGVTLATGVGFIVVILANYGSGIGLHEVAGTVLLILLAGSFWVAYRGRSDDSRPMIRVIVALVAVVVAGILGASLAAGAIPRSLGGLPLVPLAVVLAATADGLRITLELPGPSPGMEKEVR
jgi:uncharacterized membrane protein YfcA